MQKGVREKKMKKEVRNGGEEILRPPRSGSVKFSLLFIKTNWLQFAFH
jgi:hypothetical protein